MKNNIKKQYKLITVTIIFSLVYSIMNVYTTKWLEKIVMFATRYDMNSFLSLSFRAFFYFVLLYMIYFIYCNLINRLSKNIIEDVRNEIYKSILNKTYEEYLNSNMDEYKSILINDITVLDKSFILPVIRIIQNIVLGLLLLVFTMHYSRSLTVWIVALVIIITVFFYAASKIMRKKQMQLSNQFVGFILKLEEYFGGYEVIHSFRIMDIIIHRFAEVNHTVTVRQYERDRTAVTRRCLSAFLSSIMQISIIFIGLYLLIEGTMSLGAFAALVLLSSMFTRTITAVQQDISAIQSSKPLINKLKYLFSFPLQEADSEQAMEPVQFIEFRDVCFRYEEVLSGNESSYLLKDLNVTIKTGNKYAIVGKRQCGKTTLVKLLSGYFANYDGEILFNHRELRTIPQAQIHEMFAFIHRNVYLFLTDIEENITLFKDYKTDNIDRAILLSGFNLYTLEQGFETYFGDKKSHLSGEQIQRIAAARALLQDKPFFILDDDCSCVNKEARDDIENKILSIHNLTVITTTHSLDEVQLKKYDRILFLDDGIIKEQGHFTELVKRKKLFYQYWLHKENT